MLHKEQGYTSDMSAHQWKIVRPLLSPQRGGRGRPPELDLRCVVNAVFYVARTGCQWKNLPKDYPNHNSVYYYYGQWRDDGTWQRVNTALRQQEGSVKGESRNPAPSSSTARASRPRRLEECGVMTLASASKDASGILP